MELIEGENARYCTECEELKHFDEFYKRKSAKYNHSANCKECSRKKDRERYWNNHEETLERKRKWRDNNREKVRQIKRDYDNRHREKINKRARKRYQENREEIRRKSNKRQRERWENDDAFKLRKTVANSVRLAIYEDTKSSVCREYVGCTVNELKSHLQKQFDGEMDWDNYGDWHIDHIIPISFWDLDCEYQQKVCFHWSNTQPLWAEDNRSKYKDIPNLFEGIELDEEFLNNHKYV